jgi:RNA polymerase sigma-70 factor (ECF subfamily)
MGYNGFEISPGVWLNHGTQGFSVDQAELAKLYEKYGYLVHRRCLAILQNRQEADDALQDVFIRVHRYRHTQTGSSTLAWLYAIAFNCCCDLMRRRGRERPMEDAKLGQLDDRSVGHHSDADRRALLGAVLRKLDAKTREIGVLHHLNGMTQEEVAASTGYSRRTIGKKLQIFEDLFRKHWTLGGGTE